MLLPAQMFRTPESTTGNPYMCLCYVCVYIHAELALNQNNMGQILGRGPRNLGRGPRNLGGVQEI